MICTTECMIDKRIVGNIGLIKYLDTFVVEYNSMMRFVWKLLNNTVELNRFTGGRPGALKSCICYKYNVKSRVANSAIQDVKGIRRALKELKKIQMLQMQTSIERLEKSIEETKKYLDDKKDIVSRLRPNDKTLLKYKRLKQSIHYKRHRLNSKRHKLEKVKRGLDSGEYSLCFGGKSFFSKQHNLEYNGYKSLAKWRNDFRKRRNKSIYYVGESTNAGNQLAKFTGSSITLTHHQKDNKDKISGVHKLEYLRNELLSQVSCGYSTTYRFIKRRNKWCLQATVDLDKPNIISSSFQGTVGIDFNVGYIALSEIDYAGNLVGQMGYKYNPYGSKGQNLNSIREIVVDIIDYAECVGKDLVIEKLDFKRKKAKIEKSTKVYSRIAKYNRMLTQLAYGIYTDAINRRAYKRGINVIEVNPAYTSRIAAEKYCDKKKLNVHQGASYVIARRGKGFKG